MQKTFSKLKVEITDPKKDSFIIYNDCKVVFNISEIDSSFKVKMKILCDNVLIFSMIDCWIVWMTTIIILKYFII